jgi:ubiquitin C-terminal hydrolase
MNTSKTGKIINGKIPSSSKQLKKSIINRNTSSGNNEKNNAIRINQILNPERKVQRNQSSYVNKEDSQMNKKYNYKKGIRKLYKDKKLNNLSHNKIANKSNNDSYKQKLVSNVNTINRNESSKKIVKSSNKNNKKNGISSLEKNKSNLIPKTQINKFSDMNRFNELNSRTQINKVTNKNYYYFNDTNSNNTASNKINDILSDKKKKTTNNILDHLKKNNHKKLKETSFDNSGLKTKKIKDLGFKFKISKDFKGELTEKEIDINKPNYYNNYNYINSNSQKRNRTVNEKKDLNSMVNGSNVYNLNENKNDLMANNTNIFSNNKKFYFKSTIDSSINQKEKGSNKGEKKDERKKEEKKEEKKMEENEDIEIKKKINNILENMKNEKKKQIYKSINYNLPNIIIKNQFDSKEKEKEIDKKSIVANIQNYNILKYDDFNLNNNTSLNLNRVDKDNIRGEKMNKINELNKKREIESEEKIIENRNEKEKEEKKDNQKNNSKYYNFIIKRNFNGLYNQMQQQKDSNNNDSDEGENNKNINSIDPKKAENDEIRIINTKNRNLKNNRIQNEIIKINMDKIRTKYQSKKDLNKANERENIPKLITESLIGLVNLGETCYMNTGLQNLIHCVPFINQLFLVLNEFKDTIEEKIITYSFLNLCNSIINNNNYNYNNRFNINSCNPSNFRKIFCQKHKEYATHEQHDSLEFLRILLDDISKELNQTKVISKYKELTTEGKSKEEQNYEYNNFYLCRENSIIVKVFYSQIMNMFTCDCGDISYSFEKILDIPLLFPKEINNKEIDLNDLLNHYFQGEKISWSLKCPKCGQKDVERNKVIKLSILPKVIIFSLQRFNPITGVKINKIIKFDEIIDLKPFCDYDFFNGEMNAKYKLFGISNHSGTINFGHYYSFTKIGDNWYDFNDSFVKQINLVLMSRAAYFFFY